MLMIRLMKFISRMVIYGCFFVMSCYPTVVDAIEDFCSLDQFLLNHLASEPLLKALLHLQVVSVTSHFD